MRKAESVATVGSTIGAWANAERQKLGDHHAQGDMTGTKATSGHN
jgi:hypothetical protein